jgi:hypothetical protein
MVLYLTPLSETWHIPLVEEKRLERVTLPTCLTWAYHLGPVLDERRRLNKKCFYLSMTLPFLMAEA